MEINRVNGLLLVISTILISIGIILGAVSLATRYALMNPGVIGISRDVGLIAAGSGAVVLVAFVVLRTVGDDDVEEIETRAPEPVEATEGSE